MENHVAYVDWLILKHFQVCAQTLHSRYTAAMPTTIFTVHERYTYLKGLSSYHELRIPMRTFCAVLPDRTQTGSRNMILREYHGAAVEDFVLPYSLLKTLLLDIVFRHINHHSARLGLQALFEIHGLILHLSRFDDRYFYIYQWLLDVSRAQYQCTDTGRKYSYAGKPIVYISELEPAHRN